MAGRIWLVDETTDLSPMDVVVFEYESKTYAFRVNLEVTDDIDALKHEYNLLRTRSTAVEVEAEILKLEKLAKQRKQKKGQSAETSDTLEKVAKLRDVCTTLAGILAERKGVEVKHVYQLFNVSV